MYVDESLVIRNVQRDRLEKNENKLSPTLVQIGLYPETNRRRHNTNDDDGGKNDLSRPKQLEVGGGGGRGFTHVASRNNGGQMGKN